MIEYVKGDLFQTKSGVLAHACNVHGAWGGGIAAIFKRRFPNAYPKYRDHCATHTPDELLGTCFLIQEGQYQIACLFTNDGSTVPEIQKLTERALTDLKAQIADSEVVNMPQINAGIWAVPWDVTEVALKHVDLKYKVFVL